MVTCPKVEAEVKRRSNLRLIIKRGDTHQGDRTEEIHEVVFTIMTMMTTETMMLCSAILCGRRVVIMY